MKRKLVAPLLIAVTTVLGFSLTQITKNNIIFAQSLNSEQTNEPRFQPGVEEFLRTLPGNRGVSATPDPNETLEVIQTYRKLRNSPQEIEGFRTLVQRYPDSRLAHQSLGSAYRNRFQSTNDREFARLALEQYVKAAEIGLSFGRVLYNGGIRELSLNSGYPELAQQWFEQALTQYPDDFTLNLEYARLLAALNNNQAEQFFLKAIENRTAGKISPHVYYTEFLIDKQQYKKALEYSLLPGERSFNLSWVTACEAGPAETTGANRQVAWSIRQRVNRGSTRVNIDREASYFEYTLVKSGA